jgi:HEAT repeat protein
MPLLNSSDPDVRAAAYASLQQLAGEDNLSQLFALLSSSTQATETSDLGAAIIAAIGQMKDKQAESPVVLAQMAKAAPDKKWVYFNILAIHLYWYCRPFRQLWY